ncbi:hypothetical protein [Buchnera aphidicola]
MKKKEDKLYEESIIIKNYLNNTDKNFILFSGDMQDNFFFI